VPLEREELEPLLRLTLVEGIGPQRLNLLLDRFHSADAILRAPERELTAASGIGAELARRIRSAAAPSAVAGARRLLDRVRQIGAVALDVNDPAYPSAFAILPDPPPLLFALGDPSRLQLPAVAIVGTRSPTPYGRRVAEQLGRDLGRRGYAIVSGMARGVDTAAHLGALDGGGFPVGVLGHGIDLVYPPENRRLFERVRDGGSLLTEYPPGETPKAGNFPRRNRLIAALSRAVVVVEMGHQSGAQHTVTFALEQGREVMAVPGPVGSDTSSGTNQLIRDGACLVRDAEDVIEELEGVGAVLGSLPAPGIATAAVVAGARHPEEEPALPLLTPSEARTLHALSFLPRHIDELVAGTGFATSALLPVLLELELRGLVAALPGMRFVRS
jgi:DNA processing protein